MGKGIQSIVIGLDLVKQLVDSPDPLPLGRLAAAAGMSASKARGYLLSLMETGLVVQDDTSGHYQLGSYAAQIGFAALSRLDLLKISRRIMTQLDSRTGLPVVLTMWSNGRPTIMERSEGLNTFPIDFRMGGHASLTRTASGRIFLAYLPEALTAGQLEVELAENARDDDAKHITRAFLAREVDRIRQDGFAVMDRIMLPSRAILNGFGSVAAPIFDHRHKQFFVVAVLFNLDIWAPRQEELVACVKTIVASNTTSTPSPA